MPGEDHSRLESVLRASGFVDVRLSPGVVQKNRLSGVGKAHMLALETALSECKGPFIILEDDVEINSSEMEISVPPETDAIYLGLSMWGLKNGRGQIGISGTRQNGGMYRMHNMLAAHAILHVNHDYARFIANSIPIFLNMGTNQDKLRAETMKYWSVYATRKPIFYQRGKYQKYTRFNLSAGNMVPLASFY
jgi:hypothetical protein